jgi:hypothetical protein
VLEHDTAKRDDNLDGGAPLTHHQLLSQLPHLRCLGHQVQEHHKQAPIEDTILKCLVLKGVVLEISTSDFYVNQLSPGPLSILLWTISNLYENSSRYSKLCVYHYVSTTPAMHLSPEWLTSTITHFMESMKI